MNKNWIIIAFLWSFLFGMAIFGLNRMYYAEMQLAEFTKTMQKQEATCNLKPMQEN